MHMWGCSWCSPELTEKKGYWNGGGLIDIEDVVGSDRINYGSSFMMESQDSDKNWMDFSQWDVFQ